jgi:acyl carrier protein
VSDALLAELTDVFRDVFDDDALELRRELTAKDVAGWDSLTHVSLVVEVERRFGVRFTSTEVANLEDVGGLLDLLASRRR